MQRTPCNSSFFAALVTYFPMCTSRKSLIFRCIRRCDLVNLRIFRHVANVRQLNLRERDRKRGSGNVWDVRLHLHMTCRLSSRSRTSGLTALTSSSRSSTLLNINTTWSPSRLQLRSDQWTLLYRLSITNNVIIFRFLNSRRGISPRASESIFSKTEIVYG